MGGFLSAMKTKEAASLVLDFENAQPTEAEVQTHSRMEGVLERAPGVLESIENYQGCQSYVQKAISTPTDENLAAAWEALKPAVAELKSYYLYAGELEDSVPELLKSLCEGGVRLESTQALAKQLAGLLDFVIRFDHIKMNTPPIQNDFSYYRRSMQRMKYHNQSAGEDAVSDEEANRMSLFYASPTPTMTVLLNGVDAFIKSQSAAARDQVLTALSVLASSCRDMIRNKTFSSSNTELFCLRTMVAAIILFDLSDPAGAFHKKSPINVRTCVQVLADWPQSEQRVSLANMMRFTSRHLKDDSTLAGIAEQLDAAAQTGAGGGGGGNNNNV